MKAKYPQLFAVRLSRTARTVRSLTNHARQCLVRDPDGGVVIAEADRTSLEKVFCEVPLLVKDALLLVETCTDDDPLPAIWAMMAMKERAGQCAVHLCPVLTRCARVYPPEGIDDFRLRATTRPDPQLVAMLEAMAPAVLALLERTNAVDVYPVACGLLRLWSAQRPPGVTRRRQRNRAG
jgi:hypothetical protein